MRRFIYIPQVASSASYTSDFITATGISDATIISALTALEASLTTAGLINYASPSSNKIKALYPIVGGSATTHKFNFLDPRDLDAAFRLTFSGGWTHSATGAKPNGTNAYADSHLLDSVLGYIDTTLNYYTRNTPSSSFSFLIGVDDNTSPYNEIFITGSTFGSYFYKNGGNTVYSGSTPVKGLCTALSRGGTNGINLFINGTNVVSQGGQINTNVGQSYYIGGTRGYLLNNGECAFASIGKGLSNTEVSDLYSAVQTFQTSLSRQV